MSKTSVPTHIGIIMDGNRRWAKNAGKNTLMGHRQGADVLEKIAEYCLDKDVDYLSVFAFSSENWARTDEEVGYLMDLVLELFSKRMDKLMEKGMRVVFLGQHDDPRIPKKVREAIQRTEEKTKENTGSTLCVCFNYGGQQEIAAAASKAAASGKKEITVEDIAANLYHPEVPPIDLLIRTSGEKRLSNFMLWRSAYSELVFVDKHWPDFTPEDLDEAIEEYNRRHRRFGGN